ncbi:MAG: FecR family protein, partial [Bacteroidota bacterium]
MKPYENFSLEDFAADDDFIFWCLEAPKEMNEFWENWLKEHPEKKPLLLEARKLVLDLEALEKEESEGDFEQEIWKHIEKEIKPQKIIRRRFPTFLPYSIAATILLLLGVYLWNHSPSSKSALTENEWIDIKNDSGIIKHIDLPDKSIVKLEPFSSLSYRKNFKGTQREVYLKGEAFFEVEKDTSKPFLV